MKYIVALMCIASGLSVPVYGESVPVPQPTSHKNPVMTGSRLPLCAQAPCPSFELSPEQSCSDGNTAYLFLKIGAGVIIPTVVLAALFIACFH